MRKPAFAGLALCLCPLLANADLGLLLCESTGIGAAKYTAAGHAAIYLSNICADSPVHLRFCREGEKGVVISTYPNFSEDQPYQWNAAPLEVFLHGVDDPAKTPLYGNAALRRETREAYRRDFLAQVCPQNSCRSAAERWGDMAGATFTRDIYCFRLKTTRAQDEAVLKRFQTEPNRSDFQAMIHNCADFASRVINWYFPGAAKPDHLNDFFMTSPKAIAKSFTAYGRKHPELGLSVDRYSQIAGTIRRSNDNRKGTEAGFHVKKWFIPLLLFRSRELPLFLSLYYLTGHFDAETAHRDYATAGIAELRTRAVRLRAEGRLDQIPAIEEEIRLEREAKLGNREVWLSYQQEFDSLLDQAIRDGVFRKKRDVKRYFKVLARESRPVRDGSGRWMLQLPSATLGITPETLLGPDSDQLSAYRLMLAKVYSTLASDMKNRESLPEFRANWDLLSRARGATLAMKERGDVSSGQ